MTTTTNDEPPEVRPWECIYDSKPVDLGPSVAGQPNQFARVWVYDKGHNDLLGRYCVAKTLRMLNGQIRRTQADYRQGPAAIRYAQAWIEERRAKANLQPLEAA